MPTINELLTDVESETNAIAGVQKGLEAARAFAQQAQTALGGDSSIDVKASVDNLVILLDGLLTAVPANVIPASAGPVGKSPHEQYLEQASTIVSDSLTKMNEALAGVQKALAGVQSATDHAMQATAAIKSPDLQQ